MQINNQEETNDGGRFGMHAPSFSAISKISKVSLNKDNYTMEDYV